MNMVARPSQQICRKKMTFLGKVEEIRNGQIETAGDSFAKVDP
jgi:hypothetical protein